MHNENEKGKDHKNECSDLFMRSTFEQICLIKIN